MQNELFDLLYLSLLFLGLFAVAELLYHRFKVKVELTRKLVHVGTGVLTLLFPLLLDSFWSVLFLCGSFFIILIGTLKYNLLQSINAIRRESVGSLAFPVSVSICFFAYLHFEKQYIYFYVPILILAICDPIAAISGKKFPYGKYRIGSAKKTLVGSTMFFLSACLVYFCIALFLRLNIDNPLIIKGLCIAVATTIAEAVSGKGYDNITVPLAALLVLM
jgi:phytol kinase